MCNCIADTDAYLAQHNTKIHVPWVGPQIPFVETIKLDEKKRGKPVKMFASHCPFCGEHYPTERTYSELVHEERK